MKLFDLRHPFFLPLWRRLATTGFTAAWALVELSSGNRGWALLFAAITAWLIYEFFVIFRPEAYREKDDG